MTIGIVRVALFAARAGGRRPGGDDVDVEPHQLRRERGEPIVLPFGKSILDGDVLAFDPSELAQPFAKGLDEAGRSRIVRQVADSIHATRGLRRTDAWGSKQAEGAEEGAAVHH